MRITSTRNPVVAYVRSLERSRVRREEGVYLAEGVRLVLDAFTTGQPATLVLYDPAHLNRSVVGSLLISAIPGWADRAFEVSESVLASAGQTQHPSGVLAVLRRLEPPPFQPAPLGLIVDGVADPGNAGTILRTGAAAGVGYVISTPGSTDLFGPKVVRAGMGAHFRLSLYPDHTWEMIERVLTDTVVVATDVERGISLYDFCWPERAALVVGSEARGLTSEAGRLAFETVHIPMVAGVESLNASAAASIIIYQALGRTIESP